MFVCAGSSLLRRLFSSCVRASHFSDLNGCRAQALGYTGFSSWDPQA